MSDDGPEIMAPTKLLKGFTVRGGWLMCDACEDWCIHPTMYSYGWQSWHRERCTGKRPVRDRAEEAAAEAMRPFRPRSSFLHSDARLSYDTIVPILVAEIRAEHRPELTGVECATCSVLWPCPTEVIVRKWLTGCEPSTTLESQGQGRGPRPER